MFSAHGFQKKRRKSTLSRTCHVWGARAAFASRVWKVREIYLPLFFLLVVNCWSRCAVSTTHEAPKNYDTDNANTTRWEATLANHEHTANWRTVTNFHWVERTLQMLVVCCTACTCRLSKYTYRYRRQVRVNNCSKFRKLAQMQRLRHYNACSSVFCFTQAWKSLAPYRRFPRTQICNFFLLLFTHTPRLYTICHSNFICRRVGTRASRRHPVFLVKIMRKKSTEFRIIRNSSSEYNIGCV